MIVIQLFIWSVVHPWCSSILYKSKNLIFWYIYISCKTEAQIKERFVSWHAVSNPSIKAEHERPYSCVLKRFVSTSPPPQLHCPSWCATGLTCVTFAGLVSGMLSSWLEGGHSPFSCVFPSLLFYTQIFQGTEIRTERKRVLEHEALEKNVHCDYWILSKLAAIFLFQLDMSWILLSRGLFCLFCYLFISFRRVVQYTFVLECYSENVRLQEVREK